MVQVNGINMGIGITIWDRSMRNMDGYNPWVDYSEDLLSELNIFSNMSINHGIHITIDEGDSHGLRCDPRPPY